MRHLCTLMKEGFRDVKLPKVSFCDLGPKGTDQNDSWPLLCEGRVAPSQGMKWGRVGKEGGLRLGGHPSSRAWHQERRSGENGLAGRHLCLGRSSLGGSPRPAFRTRTWGSMTEGLPKAWHHSDWVRQTSLASKSDVCNGSGTHSRCLTSGRETSWLLYPESFCPPKLAPDLATLSFWQAVCAAPARGCMARLHSQLAITATSVWPQLPVLAQSCWALRPGPGDSAVPLLWNSGTLTCRSLWLGQ